MQIDGSRSTFGFSCWHGDPGPMTVAHRHDDIELNVADRDLSYLLSGATVTIPAGRVGIFWAARPHQLINVSAGTRVTWLTVPLPEFLTWGLPGEFSAALVRGRLIVPEADPVDAGARFGRWATDLGSGAEFIVHTARLEVQAFFRRLCLLPDAAAGGGSQAVDGAVSSVAAMAAFVATRFADPIGIADVAESVHLHPSYAMALFRRVVGMTIGEYLCQCRVAEAQRLLIVSRLPIGDVAIAAGFGSISQFHDRFRAACCLTPGAYRRQHAGQLG